MELELAKPKLTAETSEPTPEPNENAIENAESTRGPEEITSKNAEDIAVENAEDIVVETITPTIEIAPRNNVKVYSMKRKKGVESCTTPRQNQETSKTLVNGVLSGNISPNFVSVDDIDIPTALRKNVRSCNKHPIERFISYGKLS